jgi:hypothetical protein
LGITTRDSNGRFKSLSEILSEIVNNWNTLNKNKDDDDDELYLKIPYSAIKNYELELSMGETTFVDFTADASKIERIGDFI